MKLPRIIVFKKIISEIKGPIFGILLLVTIGTIALAEVEEQWDYSTALYYLIVTLSTVGFGDENTQTTEGRLVTALLIVVGIIMVSLFASSIGNRVIQNMLNHDFRYEQAIKNYEDHIIIAGYNDIGRRVAEYLTGWRIQLVIIDNDYEMVEVAREDGFAALDGDVANPREMIKLNIKTARGLVLAINDPDTTLFAAQAAKVANPNIWVIAEKNIHFDRKIYKSVQISDAIDRYSATKSKIRGILWGLEIENFDFSMNDGTSFFQIPFLKNMDLSVLDILDFQILGAIKHNIFEKFDKKATFENTDFLLVAGPSAQTSVLTDTLRSFLPPDEDGVLRVMLVGYGDYAQTILNPIINNADEVIVIDRDEEARKLAKKTGGVKVQSRSRPSIQQFEQADIILLTSKSAGSMLSIGLQGKNLNPKVKIYARATISEHTPIFENAGADFVFSPEVDCAMKLSSICINNLFKTHSVPFANGQLLSHSGDVKIKHVKSSEVLAVFKASKGETEFFGKRSKKQEDTIVEFVTFKEQSKITKRLDQFVSR